jgi:4-hydroxy-4-methyl-2-oxoglutarate aldolase
MPCSQALLRSLALAAVLCLTAAAQQQTAPPKPRARTPRPPPSQLAPQTVPDQVKLFIPYRAYTQEENERILNLFRYLRVSDVSDGMDIVGLTDVGLVDPEIKALWRDTENFTHRAVGIAVTARYVPTNKRVHKIDPAEIGRWYANITTETFMDVLHPGSILVIDAADDGESRSIGSSNIMAWQKLGMRAVITSGGLADSDEIIHNKVPAYYKRLARGIRPGRNELESVNRPVNLGGVLVRPGDVVMADGDGVVVVPREHAEEVAAASMQFLDNVGLERMKKAMGESKPAPRP